MEQQQPVTLRLSHYVTAMALAVSAAGLARTLYRSFSPTPKPTPSIESEAIVSDIDQDKRTGIIVAAVVGAAIGAGVALLCAPQSGRESREWLAGRARGLKERAGAAIEHGAAAVSNGVIPS